MVNTICEYNTNGEYNTIAVRWQQDKTGKEAWEDVEENPVACTAEGKRWKGNINEELRESKTGTVLGIRRR